MGVRVIRPAGRVPDVASGAMRRETAISGAFWMGYVELPPGLVSAVHHHGRSESAIFVISGRARFCWGEELEQVEDAEAGDFVWVPPEVVHVEINRSDSEPVRTVVVRSTSEAIVVDVPAPEGWVPPR